MSKLAITFHLKALLGVLLLLPGGILAEIIQTLPEIRVTASADGAGAGEGDLDETVLAPEDLERFGVETLEDLSALAPRSADATGSTATKMMAFAERFSDIAWRFSFTITWWLLAIGLSLNNCREPS